MAGINRSANRPKTAKHLRNTQSKSFTNRTKEERDRDHALSDSFAERERLKESERIATTIAARVAAEKKEV